MYSPLISKLVMAAMAVAAPSMDANDRGQPHEYDPGPAEGSGWAELFAENPNYRQLGIDVISGGNARDEKFRWTFGPMFYRGRLTENSVKVFIIGQEGAQDESLSNRAFTGGTGIRMQALLKHIGVTESYLFMNTFVYTINGQYGDQAAGGATPPALFWLAQNLDSPLVQYRHKMFDHMLETNRDSLALVISVGTAARDTLQTWVKSHGGECENVNNNCDSSVLGRGVKVLAVPHPGAASPRNGGSGAVPVLVETFDKAAKKIARWASEDDNWLPSDVEGRRIVGQGNNLRFAGNYIGPNTQSLPGAAIPYADFAFGTTWRLGSKASTTSNRKDSQRSIQLFSAGGCYNNLRLDANGRCPRVSENDENTRGLTANLRYRMPTDLTRSLQDFRDGEVEWESPRANASEFDAGPGRFARLLMGTERGFEYPDFTALGAIQHASLGTTQSYRGRLDDAEVLVLADQESNDDLFTGRALSGEGGQRLQTFLKALGAGSSYGILRTIPVDTLGLDTNSAIDIALDSQLEQIRIELISRILSRGRTKVILAVGPVAQAAMEQIDTSGVRVVKMASSLDRRDWGQAFGFAQNVMGTSGRYEDRLTDIPRGDFPIHTKRWVGTGGSRAVRAFNADNRAEDGNYYKIVMPEWVFRLRPKALNRVEAAAVETFRRRR
jgi:uracil-DNA glycosylase